MASSARRFLFLRGKPWVPPHLTLSYSRISRQTAGFQLKGGSYGVAVQATFGGQTVTFQMVGPDGSNYVSVCTATAANFQVINIPAGQFRFTVGTATAVYAEVIRIPTWSNLASGVRFQIAASRDREVFLFRH
jgi:hypothetical protein